MLPTKLSRSMAVLWSTRAFLCTAAGRGNLYIHTPLVKHKTININNDNAITEVFYKMDLLQPSGSFKDRGISHMIRTLKASKSVSKLICSSGGNAGHAVAYASEYYGIPCDVYVPCTTLPMMVEKIKKRGANVFVDGENWNAADQNARKALAEDKNAEYIPPYDDILLWEGHATVIDEIKKDLGGEKPDTIIVSVGGGGLLVGVQKVQ